MATVASPSPPSQRPFGPTRATWLPSRPRGAAKSVKPRAWAMLLGFGMLVFTLANACATAPPSFDSAEYLRHQIDAGSPNGSPDGSPLADIAVPFELSPELAAEAARQLKPKGDDRERAAAVIDYVFHGLDLQYSLEPTRDADGTYRSHTGNCLSFVNLFVALARGIRLSPFYVEVEDYQRWNHRQGMVISQGHIVAGLYIGGDLKTYDFMPYRVKSYRQFRPIDDLTATAHYYNNLGAEALLGGREEEAGRYLEIAGRIDPSFVKGANNLGVLHARRGEHDKAIEIYRGALEIEPQNVPLLSNLARAYQQTGRTAEAEEILASIEGVHHNNPFFYVYRADVALSRGDQVAALDFLRQALALDSEAPEVHLGLARVYVAAGEIEKAKHHLERAIKLDPTHPEARQLAALLLPALLAPPQQPPPR